MGMTACVEPMLPVGFGFGGGIDETVALQE